MSDNKPFIEVRAKFAKTGSAMWFSHLDLSRAVSRALRRSKLDIWMSQGFTPRPHLVFTPPLSLGYESHGEILEFRLNLGAQLDEDKLKEVFPPCLPLISVYYPKTKLKEIAYADYTVTFESDTDAEFIKAMFSAPVEMVKKTKRSEQVMDITTLIKSFEVTKSDFTVKIAATLCCGAQEGLNPSYIVKALEQAGVGISRLSVCRECFRTENMKTFE